MPHVSVLMSVYNGEQYLAESIESILNQTYTNFEFLIINDSSTDKTEEIILSYKDHRIVYVKNEKNLRLIASLNRGLQIAKGKYIARMDADDVSLPIRLERQVFFMENNPVVGVCGSFVQNIGQSNNMVSFRMDDESIRFRLLFSTYIRHPSVMIRKSVLDTHQIFYKQDYLHVEDHQFWIDISKVAELAIIPEVLLRYRVHTDNISIKQNEIQGAIESKIRREQLERLDICLNDNELLLMNSFYHIIRPEWNSFLRVPLPNTQEEFNNLFSLLNKIISKNRALKVFPVNVLEKEFSKAYFTVIQHTTHFGISFMIKALNGVALEPLKIGIKQKLLLILKSAIRKKYDYNRILKYYL